LTRLHECAAANGGCDPNATCSNTAGSHTCTCNDGFTGDGQTCTPPAPAAGGCGCNTDGAGSQTLFGGAFVLGLVLRRRRRAGAAPSA